MTPMTKDWMFGPAGVLAGAVAAFVASVALAPSSATTIAQGGPAAADAPVHYNQDYLNGPPPATPVPAWAFAMDPPASADLKRGTHDDLPLHVPNSPVSLTRSHVLNHNDAADWHPDDHPPAPSIVMYGRKPQPAACAFCHLPNGRGLPENAPLAGLPYDYFVQQVHDFQNGSRKSADMRMASFHGMADVIAPKIREDELHDAAAYFSSLKLKPYLQVIETDRVPKTHSVQYTMMPVPEGGAEPIGDRIIETPQDAGRFALIDSEMGYRVYVPRGSIRRGERLARTGDGGRVTACISCHGADLRGVGNVPPIAGRGPSNLVRQLYNFRVGARGAPDAQLMLPVARSLSDADIVDVVAYAASRRP